MKRQTNSRGFDEFFIESQHLKLHDVKQEAEKCGFKNRYLSKEDIPPYPRPVLHVSRLTHDTNEVRGVSEDGGFKDPNNGSKDPDKLPLVWWSLAVGPEEIRSAEARLLETTYPNRTQEQAAKQQSFLWRFATSPAFSEKSRYGSYRFTFPLEEVLKTYSEQFCCGAPPVMRVLRTAIYKQAVQYVVLVHSPHDDERFSKYPRLPEDDRSAVCAFREGRFIWRPEAMCETHRYELIQRPEENLMDLRGPLLEFYVWDQVALALHVESGQVLKFDSDDLRRNLTFCEKDQVVVTSIFDFNSFEGAENVVKGLWPESALPLQKEAPLQQSFRDLCLQEKRPRDDETETEGSLNSLGSANI